MSDVVVGGYEARQSAWGQVGRAGLEIGCWCFLANVATLIGFSMTTAAQGAFFLRLTAVFTPLCSLLIAAEAAPRPAWLASLLALLGGILLLGPDSARSLDAPFQMEGLHGSLLVLLAAALWSIQTVRQGQVHPSPRRMGPSGPTPNQYFSLLWDHSSSRVLVGASFLRFPACAHLPAPSPFRLLASPLPTCGCSTAI